MKSGPVARILDVDPGQRPSRNYRRAAQLQGGGRFQGDSRAGLRDGEAIVSTISLGSEAGLVGGAFAPLIGGAHLIWQAPFAAQRFLETLEASAPAHLFAPAGVASDLGAAGLLTADRLSSLTLATADAAVAPGFAHGVDSARVFVLRAGAEEGLRLEPIDVGAS